ncbi:MAG: hypothetical protein RMJ35_02200 [Phycisphaerales bacterium]|nr:hypothetical protein [Phycisphaerales bacterium]
MLATVAFLVIVAGLALNLAREVRRQSAETITRELLAGLEQALARYLDVSGGRLPEAPVLIAGDAEPDSSSLDRRALDNNRAFLRALRASGGMEDPESIFARLPRSMYDDLTLRDAWGKPIVLMNRMHPRIGMAVEDKPFFFSAGADRNYLTREDNVYSYEGPKG